MNSAIRQVFNFLYESIDSFCELLPILVCKEICRTILEQVILTILFLSQQPAPLGYVGYVDQSIVRWGVAVDTVPIFSKIALTL